ncbi:MAG: hypothetical protein IPP71_22125 [Bacteroidetes bacterium]|nr:hypothetical protein [Bacteroidota bacterium]
MMPKPIERMPYSTWQILKRKRIVRFSLGFILTLAIIALLAPIIANDRPLFFSYKGHVFFPVLTDNTFVDIKTSSNERIVFTDPNLKNLTGATVIMPLVPYAPNKSDLENSDYTGPFDEQSKSDSAGQIISLNGWERHLLGTGKRGEDLFSGLIHGTRVSLTVGVFSMTIAGLIGLFLGSLAGFFGDHQLKINRGKIALLIVGLIPAWFYAFEMRLFHLADALKASAFTFIFQFSISILIFFQS